MPRQPNFNGLREGAFRTALPPPPGRSQSTGSAPMPSMMTPARSVASTLQPSRHPGHREGARSTSVIFSLVRGNGSA
eukprot:14426961-Alexandrium_andersonii.AAC.1